MSQAFPGNPTAGQKLTSPKGHQCDNHSHGHGHDHHDHEDPKPEPQPQETQPQTPVQTGPISVDVVASYQSGNYLPLLHCLNNNLISLDFFDQTGYHPIHSAVAANLIPIVIIFLDHYKIDINLKAKNGQTPLMIAANYGNLHILKALCDRGADINEQDETRFTALMYSVKAGHLPVLAFLLSKNADIHTRDTNGCTVVHWAAYKNNVFLLKMFKTLGLDLNIVDFTGMTPIDRAVQGNAFKAVPYLLEHGSGAIPANMDFSKIGDPEMKEILRRKYYKSSLEVKWGEVKELLKEHAPKALVGFHISMAVMAIVIYLHAIVSQGSNYIGGLIFMVFALYFMVYASWYYLKSASENQPLKKRGYDKLISLDQSTDSSRDTREMTSRVEYGALNKLTQNRRGDANYDSTFLTFLHELVYLIQTETFKEIDRFNENDYCPVCLIRRPERSCHCEEEKACVEEFCHYSHVLGGSITRSEHYQYFIQVINQMFILTHFLFAMWSAYWEQLGWKTYIAETWYLLSRDFGLFYAGFYALVFVLWVHNIFYFLVETYGVVKNVTYYEIFNSMKCSYLYRVRMDRKGNYVKRSYNPYDKGVGANLKEYINRMFH